MTGDICNNGQEILTLTEDALHTYLFDKRAVGLKATVSAKYHLGLYDKYESAVST